eukprot:jgi/Bigna1/135623/aug1.30_g10331
MQVARITLGVVLQCALVFILGQLAFLPFFTNLPPEEWEPYPETSTSREKSRTQRENSSLFGSTLGWQEHSKNDLRAWPQMLRKGGRNFKVDFNFQPSSICALQSRARERARECFILNQEKPVYPANFRSGYNVSDDILTFIADPRYRTYFGSKARERFRSAPFLIQLSLRNAPKVCEEGAPTNAWLSLIDDFFKKANAIILKHSLYLEFVIDGDGSGPSICGCLEDRWRPWVATFIPGYFKGTCMDTMAAAIGYKNKDDDFDGTGEGGPKSRNDSIIQTAPYDRYQILNAPSRHFESVASRRFGRFINSSYPILIWEPKDQREILQRVREYVVIHGKPHPPGLHFTINIDSAMLQVYWAAAAVLGGNRGEEGEVEEHDENEKDHNDSGAWNMAIVKSSSSSNSSAPKVIVLQVPAHEEGGAPRNLKIVTYKTTTRTMGESMPETTRANNRQLRTSVQHR